MLSFNFNEKNHRLSLEERSLNFSNLFISTAGGDRREENILKEEIKVSIWNTDSRVFLK